MTEREERGDATAQALATEIRRIAGRLKRRLREISGVGDMPVSQIVVLLRLESEGQATVSDLARAEGMRPQSMGAIIAALEAAGHVQGRPDPADGRRTLLSLTERCVAWMQAGRIARQDMLAGAIAARLSPEEQRQLGAALPLLARLVE
ncbi:MarR family winged helix-turn-helix transcriptional regulator [Acidisoma sp. 7E03]